MRFAFVTEASTRLGPGPVMRCLTLAETLRLRGHTCVFHCPEVVGNMNTLIVARGFNVRSALAPDATFDWVVVDHYGLDASYEQHHRQVMVIDDLANRKHHCQVLLDQNFYQNANWRYEGKVPAHCARFLGPRHALLRPEILEARRLLTDFRADGTVDTIQIFMGGSDPDNVTRTVLKAVLAVRQPRQWVEVIVGATNPHLASLEALCVAEPRTEIVRQTASMGRRMVHADLAIGAGGTAQWERCYLGLPTLTLITAPNQAETSLALSEAGAAWCLGRAEKVSAWQLKRALKTALAEPALLASISRKAMALMGERSSPVSPEILAALER